MNDRFLRACRGERVSPVPVWIMRQAGRYLPQYQEIRNKVDFLTLCKTPELAAEVTLQPIDFLGVDAAILFSDILIFVEALGLNLQFDEGKGPVIKPAIRTNNDLKSLRNINPELDLSFVYKTIVILKERLKNRVPLIGFAGAPFTVLTYLIEGGSSKNFINTKKILYSNPNLYHDLMTILTEFTTQYLDLQINHGVDAVQIFDTWAGILNPDDYEKFVLPYISRLINELKTKDKPIIYFAYNSLHLYEKISTLNADVFAIDWRTPLQNAINIIGKDRIYQGNLDPCALFMPKNALKEKIKEILNQGKNAKSHIFNLGHGILPECPADMAKFLVECVHELSM